MNKTLKLLMIAGLFAFLLTGCSDDSKDPTKDPTPNKQVNVPKFEQDSAYQYVEKQVSFGPRVPNSPAHTACKNWLSQKMQSLGADVIEQDFQATGYTGEVWNGTNIIAQYNKDNPIRILLCAHWDSRHISDYDPLESNQSKPVLGADDGGSGVGVLIEIARHLQQTPIDLGVDIVFFDLEDNGESQAEDYTSWCLGSQHWSRNPHKKGYKAKFGILLDMVGKEGARFTLEEVSMTYAPTLMRKVWKLGRGMGYSTYFVNEETGPVIDDHLFVNKIARIPTIDIINRPLGTKTGFHECWHTQCDDMTAISKRTLRAAGQTVLAATYRENNGTL